MRKISFYPKLALTNIRSNGKLYYPYLLTCTFAVAMFYIVLFIRYNEGLQSVRGAAYVESYMAFGSVIISIFSLVILFYTNSFLMKRRRRELGLYNILGMEKRHIASVLFFETILTGLGSLFLGILTGIVFSKLVYMLLMRLIQFPVPLGMSVSFPAILSTVTLFSVIFLVILCYNLWHIRLSNPIDLLRSNQVGQKEPKTKAFLALFGLLTLAGGYTLAILVKSPLDAILWFFIAVILVIIGTYCLFTAGSITLLKILRSNKTYYYKTKHFISISSMLYRMKQNAVGLSNICILSTMVLVTVSTTATLYAGMSSYIDAMYPYDIGLRFEGQEEDTLSSYSSFLEDLAAEKGYEVTAETWYEYWNISAGYENGEVFAPSDYNTINCYLVVLKQEEYSRYVGQDIQLDQDEILLFIPEGNHSANTVTLFGTEYRIQAYLEDSISQMDGIRVSGFQSMLIVVSDDATVERFYQAAYQNTETYRGNQSGYVGISIEGSDEEKLDFYEIICDFIYKDPNTKTDFSEISVPNGRGNGYATLGIHSRQMNEDEYFAMYGAFLFLGIFLGLLFLMATILIMYYKQITEGYDDRERFTILQKVGMSPSEVRASIRSQVLTVFFLPLTVAGIHICFAFPMIVKIIQVFGLYDLPLFIVSTVSTFVLFAIIYLLVYTLTARVYYKIVR